MPKKEKTGIVVSDKMNQTVVVAVHEYKPHPKYKKIQQSTKNYLANNIKGEAAQGDTVRIIESRPVSKNKCWSVAEVIEKAK